MEFPYLKSSLFAVDSGASMHVGATKACSKGRLHKRPAFGPFRLLYLR